MLLLLTLLGGPGLLVPGPAVAATITVTMPARLGDIAPRRVPRCRNLPRGPLDERPPIFMKFRLNRDLVPNRVDCREREKHPVQQVL